MSATGILITVGTIAGIYALLALALNVKFGETGILDFGHVAYFLVGAYVAALFVMPPPEEYRFQDFLFGLNLHTFFIETTGVELLGGLGWLIAIMVAIVAAGFFGLVVALPAIRLRADYLAIALLGVAVITFRFVQSEGWFANGPDALRGYPRLFTELLPLPSSSPSASILLGMLIMLVWFMALFLLSRADLIDSLDDRLGRATEIALWGTSLGAGYWAAKRTRRNVEVAMTGVGTSATPRDYGPIIAVAAVYGFLAMIGALVGLGNEVILLFFGVGSLLIWIVVGMRIRGHYREYTRRSALTGFAIAVGLLVAFAPTNVLGIFDGPIEYVGAALTFILLGVYAYGLYYLYTNWESYDVPGAYFGVIGIAVLWLLAIRYFAVPVAGAGSVDRMIDSTLQNIFWLIDFDATLGPSMDYRRFFFLVVIGIVMGSYFLLEVLRKSPYGRVLRAIRDDENVAMSLGKNTFYYKVQAMVIGGAFAGLAGALGAIYYRSLSYALFNPIITFFIFLAVILGGRANNKGVILGAVFYWIFVRGTTEFAAMFPGGIGSRLIILRNALIGMALILILYYKPEGIWPEERTIVEAPNP